jgi:CMP/dCMP kinase
MTTDTDSIPVITIDGPSGSGKGTVARLVAEALGWHLLDSGALYRLVAVAAEDAGIDEQDHAALAALAAALAPGFGQDADGGERICLAGEDVTLRVRHETTGARASRIAPIPAVRSALLELQRGLRRAPGLVADGRDMGTVVFPDATLKVFLDASPEERAQRRHKQLMEKGIDVNLRALFAEVTERDRRDREREIAPLRPASDAVVLDSTALSVREVVDQLLRLERAARPQPD